MCELGNCPHWQALDLARTTVEGTPGVFESGVKTAKTNEFALFGKLLEESGQACPGLTGENRDVCGREQVFHEAAHMVFGSPQTPISTSNGNRPGYHN